MFTGKKKAACAAMLSMAMVAPLAAFAENETRVITCGTLNLRAEPNGNILGSYPRGTKVTVLATTGEWSKVSVDGKTGYMMAKYLKVTADMHNGTARVFNANGGSYVNFRSRASLSANVIGTVPVGTTVKVLEKTTDWTKVEVNGKTGYISTWFLKF